ncbi:MAG: HPr(Ser) kinase/phosphatase [endosymbiont of Galathealinum brachiosum]|uniref:HPr kinase/phosphorylase n=1 Tax=endosymbiont of Galathealinum brachiosum TaxID=2200906 RepID=A0A370D910_9GAMM|nr:MAG: HPr(Ser) kinase/phosphatase [endosymbiont of Galathealinum brachiosum]
MLEQITPLDLFHYLQKNIDIKWLAGKAHSTRAIKKSLHLNQQSTLVGHLNLIHPNRIQVIGKKEWHYLNKLKQQSNRSLSEIFSRRTAAIVFTNGQTVPDEMIQLADEKMTPLFQSDLYSGDFIDSIRFYLSDLLAEKITLHGVFMEVMGSGVLITGESSIGKSELALELITRGHRLIADDAPIFTRIGPNLLDGSCPEVLKNFMEVRGLGVLDIRAMYGENAIKPNKHLRLIIHLERMTPENQQQLDRLYGSRSIKTILEVPVTEIKLPVASGRNLAVMVEAAVRNHILIENGHNASDEFILRQQQHMNNSN